MGAFKNQMIREADANATDNAEEVERLRDIIAIQNRVIWHARQLAHGILDPITCNDGERHADSAEELLRLIENREV